MADIAIPQDEEIECPICKKAKIAITIVPEHYSYHMARAFSKAKRIPVHHPERVTVHSKCPNCGASKKEIKETMEQGGKVDHKELLKRLKREGLPTKLEF